MVFMIYLWKVSTSVYFHQSQSRKKEPGLLKKTILVAGFLLGFVSETQIIHFSFILLFSKCPFSKGSFCIKSICKNNFLYLFHANMYAIHTFSWRQRYFSCTTHGTVFFSIHLEILIVFFNNALFKFKFGRYVYTKK